MFYQLDVVRDKDLWKVTLRRVGDPDKTVSEGIAADLVQATGAAIAQLTSALDLSPLPYNEGSGQGATLAQEVTSELLQDRIADARGLIEKAPPDVRTDPRVRLQSAAVDFYQQTIDKYGTVTSPPYKWSLGQEAESALFKLRHLQVGKVAPEIDGEDIDGKRLKLSDYRGKVVVLSFWGHW